MSLYDDILIDKIQTDGDDSGWSSSSGIKLLQDHLQTKKTSQLQNKRDAIRKTVHVTPVLGLGRRMKDDEMPPPPVIVSSTHQTKGSLLGGDWDLSKEYDPLWPNDYEKIMKERKEQRERERELERAKEIEEREKRRRERFDRSAPRSLGLDYGDDDDEDDDDDHDEVIIPKVQRPSGGAAIAPPPSLLAEQSSVTPPNEKDYSGVSSVAAKIMAKMGYKEGQGLGREEQGMSTALKVEKTSQRGGKIIHEKDELMPPPPPPLLPTPAQLQESNESITEIMKNPSKVVLLRNMVGPGEVDEDLEPETKEECGKYGEVIRCLIYEITGEGVSDEESVRIFIEFKRVESAIKAVVDLNGRYFGGRIVKAAFYDTEKFKRLELKD